MRLKQRGALLLASIMLIGCVEIMNPVEARATTADSFTITVPANVNIANNGWNSIGNVNVAGNIAADKKITVSIATTNGFKLKSENNEVGYTIKKTSNDKSPTTSFDFAADDVNVTGGASQSIGADVDSFTGMPAGNYTDTITFTAKLEDKVTALTMKNVSGYTLSTADLGAPSEFTVSSTGKKYYAYNDFIKKTSGSNWNDAICFVRMLNDNEYGGYKDWMLINDVEEDGSKYKSAIGEAWRDNNSSTERDGVDCLWLSVASDSENAFYFQVYYDIYEPAHKSNAHSYSGFLVLRRSSN